MAKKRPTLSELLNGKTNHNFHYSYKHHELPLTLLNQSRTRPSYALASRDFKMDQFLPSLKTKVRCAFPIVILSDFRMGQHRDDDNQEDAPHFTIQPLKVTNL